MATLAPLIEGTTGCRYVPAVMFDPGAWPTTSAITSRGISAWNIKLIAVCRSSLGCHCPMPARPVRSLKRAASRHLVNGTPPRRRRPGSSQTNGWTPTAPGPAPPCGCAGFRPPEMAFRRFSRSEESSSHPTPPRMVGEGEIGECGSPSVNREPSYVATGSQRHSTYDDLGPRNRIGRDHVPKAAWTVSVP